MVKGSATWQIAHGNDDDRNHKHKGGGEKNKVSKKLAHRVESLPSLV